MSVRRPSVKDYYATRESRWGYKLFLRNTRHFGWYKTQYSFPFPISRSLRQMEQKLYDALNLPANARVLDAGCGVADVASYLAKQGLFVEAIDLVDRHITLARKNIKQRGLSDSITVTKMNYQELGFQSNYFDGIYTVETFVHATNPEKALSEFFRVMKPGGKLVLFEYDKAEDKDMPEVAARAFRDVNKYASMPTFQKFTYGTPEKMLKNAGFENVQIEDATDHIMPMLRIFSIAAHVPYLFVRLFRQQHNFVNTMSAVEYYRYHKYLRYIVVTANKPA